MKKVGQRSQSPLSTAEDVDRGKPDPAGYALALAAINGEPPLPSRLIHPHECAAIEDSPAGVRAAAAAGLRTVGLAQSYSRESLDEADIVLESLDGVKLSDLARRLG